MRTEEPLRTEKKPLDLTFIDGDHDEHNCFGHMPKDGGLRCSLCPVRVPCAPLSRVYSALVEVRLAALPEQLPKHLASEVKAVREEAIEKLKQLRER